MGVPGLFSWIKRNFEKEIFSKNLPKDIDHLFIDFNGLIYIVEENFNYLAYKDQSEEQIENAIIDQVIKYTQKYIFAIRPRKSISICMDGVVTMAKNHLKRLRMFKSPYIEKMEDELDKKYDKYVERLMDIRNITAGSPFMERLTRSLEKAIQSKFLGPLPIHFSACNSIGEGEHKIISMIKKKKISKDEKIGIYCSDGDMIILSQSLHTQKILIMKEARDTAIEEFDFEAYNMETLYDCIFKSIRLVMNEKKIDTKDVQKDRVMKDFVFLSFFMGNDFLHNLPSISIPCQGIEFVFDSYVDCFKNINAMQRVKKYIISFVDGKVNVNHQFVKALLRSFAEKEVTNIRFVSQNRIHSLKKNYESEYELEKWKLDRVAYNPEFQKYAKPIDYFKPDWREKYYNIFFDLVGEGENLEKELDTISKNYFEGIMFLTRYYFDLEYCWEWFKPYYASPLVSDLSKYLDKIGDLNSIVLERGEPFSLFEQKMLSSSKDTLELLPKCLQEELSKEEYSHFFPEQFEWVACEKSMTSQIEPKIPPIDVKLFRQIYSTLKDKLSEEEKLLDVVSME